MEKKLTPKQELFIEAYLGKANGNATEAARLAGYKGNDVTLATVGTENLRKPQIAQAIKERLAEKKDVMSADEVLETLTKIARNQNGWQVAGQMKALELLGKHHKLFTDKVEHSGTIAQPITLIEVVKPKGG